MSHVEDFKKLKNYLFLWFSQSLSTLGSLMTSFALSIWAYEHTGNVITLSLSGLTLMLPRMLCGILTGPLIDRLDKKAVMILSDISIGLCSLILFLLLWTNSLEIWHVYCINLLHGVINGVKTPADDVAITMTVPKDLYLRANGLRSAAIGLVEMLAPIFAALLLGFVGMPGVILVDVSTMFFAIITLILFVKIQPVPTTADMSEDHRHPNAIRKKLTSNNSIFHNYLQDLSDGFAVVKSSKLLFSLLLYFAFINFIAGITYLNLITPMILARSNENTNLLGFVNSAIGFGGIVGGLLAAFVPSSKSKVKTIFVYMGMSFVLGDTMFAIGARPVTWIAAGFISSVFVPMSDANNVFFWRTIVPVEFQGRTFALKSAIQTGIIPFGMLVGGFLADYVFEPLMTHKNFLTPIFGSTAGSGMALMFMMTGVLGTTASVIGYFLIDDCR